MTIIYLSVAWLTGLWLAATFRLPAWACLVSGALSLVVAFALRRQAGWRLGLACLGFLGLGAARWVSAVPPIDQNHVAAYNAHQDVVLIGMVVDEPEIRDRSAYLRLRVESLILPGGERRQVEGLVLVRTRRLAAEPYGTRLQASGLLEPVATGGEPGYEAHLARQGIYSQISWPSLTVLARDQGSPILQAIFAVKKRAQETVNRLLPDPQASLISGILLGNELGLPPVLRQQFRDTGLTHIIAISGFNIAILVGVLLAVSRPFLGFRRSAVFALTAIAVYTVLVGAGASVVRAAIMGTLYVVAHRFLGRPTFAPAGLFTAALVMTLADPFVLWDVGFQLSFAATLGLMLYVGPLGEWATGRLEPWTGPDVAGRLARMLSEVVFASFAATLLTLPLLAYHFGQISLVSPVANLFVLPAQPGVLVWGGLAALVGMILPAVGQLLAWVAWLFLTYTIGLVRFFAGFPGAAAAVSLPAAGLVTFYVLILGLTWLVRQPSERRAELVDRFRRASGWRTALAGSLIVALLVVAWALSQPDGRLQISFLDVGQGDATFIQTPGGRYILVDGGAFPSILNDHLGRRMPFWDREIDIVVATHPDADHVAGLSGLFERYSVGRLITNGQTSTEESYRALLAAAAENGTPVRQAVAGETITVGEDIRFEVLNPTTGPQSAINNQNDNSVALRLVYGDFTLLLTGDAGEPAEGAMLASGRALSAIVYKAGHHGASSSSSAEFLAAVRPQYVIVSVGKDNRFGHPHPEMLERAAGAGAAVLRTDELGTIEVVTNGHQMWWEQ